MFSEEEHQLKYLPKILEMRNICNIAAKEQEKVGNTLERLSDFETSKDSELNKLLYLQRELNLLCFSLYGTETKKINGWFRELMKANYVPGANDTVDYISKVIARINEYLGEN